MPVFTYQAKNSSGQTVSGEISASDERAAAAQVRALGQYPMRVERLSAMRPAGTIATTAVLDPNVVSTSSYQAQSALLNGTQAGQGRVVDSPRVSLGLGNNSYGLSEVRPYGSWFEQRIVNPIWTGVSMPALSMYYRQLAAMLNAGMTVNRALEAMQMQSDPPLRKISFVMRRHVEAGGKMSEAMGMFPQVFRPLHRFLVEAAEGTGALDGAFLRLSAYVDSDYELRRVIKKETFMPKINLVATFLLPPLYILIVSGTQAYINTAVVPLLRLLVEALAVYVVGRYALTIAPVAVIYDTIKSYLPYFGTTVRMLSNAKFARALSALYTAGVSIPTAIKTASKVSGNAYLSAQMNKASASILSGSSLTEAFESAGIFPPMFLSMIRTGETTGSLDTLLDKVAGFYEDESEVRLKQSVQAFNTLVFLIIAVLVGREVIGFWQGYGNQFTDQMKD